MTLHYQAPDNITGYSLRPQHPKIKLAVKYIEEHINESISMDMLLELTNLSYSHFNYLFKQGTGFPPKNYVYLRSMHRAAQFLVCGESVSKVAKRYGYNKLGNFTRAFTNTFGISPQSYIKVMTEKQVEPEIRFLEGRFLVGFRFDAPTGKFNYLDHAAYWQHQHFDPEQATVYNVFAPAENGEAGVWVPMGLDGNSTACYIYGVPVKSNTAVPKELSSVLLRSGNYALFEVPAGITFADSADNLRAMLRYALHGWLPASDYFLDDSTPIIEYYHGEKIHLAIPLKEQLPIDTIERE